MACRLIAASHPVMMMQPFIGSSRAFPLARQQLHVHACSAWGMRLTEVSARQLLAKSMVAAVGGAAAVGSVTLVAATDGPPVTDAGEKGQPQQEISAAAVFQTTLTGLQYADVGSGSGSGEAKQPKIGEVVRVHYEGRLRGWDGPVFDSSYARFEPIEFQLGSGIHVHFITTHEN